MNMNRYKFLFLIVAIFFFGQIVYAQKTWNGNVSTNWNTAGNWSPNGIPTASDSVVINNGALTNQPVISTAVTVNDVSISAGTLTVNSSLSASTINQSGTSNINVGAGGSIVISSLIQTGGVFNLGSGSINGNINTSGTFNGGSGGITGSITTSGGAFNGQSSTIDCFDLEINGGIFTSTGGNLFISNNFTGTGGTFNAGSGTVIFDSSSNSLIDHATTLTFQNLQIAKSPNTASVSLGTGDSLNVTGTFTLSNGTFNAGNSTLTLSGNYTQTGGIFNGGSGNIVVNGNFSITASTFTATSGTTSVAGTFTVNSSIFTSNGGTVVFTNIFNSTVNVTPDGALAFDNVEINKSSDSAGVFVTGGDTLRVNGNLNLTNGRIIGSGGSVEVLGTVIIANTFDGGDGLLFLNGNATRTVTIPAPLSMPRFIIDAPNTTINTSGTGTISFSSQVQLLNAVSFTNGAADFNFVNSYTQTGGVFNVGSGAMTFQAAFTQSGGTFMGSSSTLNFNNNLGISGGTFTASSGITSISNGFTVSNAIFQANGGTVIFTGIFTSNIGVLPDGVVQMNNVEVNKSNDAAGLGIAGSDTMQVNGKFTLTNGRIVGGAGGTPQANGNLIVASTFDGGDGRMAFGGANVQTFQNNGGILPTGTWTLNKTGGTVNLLSDLDISGGTSNFTLTEGTITTGANTVIAGTRNVVNTNGFIIGGLRRSYNAAGSRLFAVGTANGFAPVTIVATLGTFGPTTSFTVRSNDGTLGGASATQSITRNWTLEPVGITLANLTFQYLQTDVPGGADESSFTFLRRNGGMTTNEGITTLDTTNNTAFLSGVSNFSDWGLGQLAPLAANIIVGGRVLTNAGQGIYRARLSLTDANGNVRSTQTNPFGYYRFDEVEAGQIYIISVAHKSYQFANPTQILNVSDSITDFNFIAENATATQGLFEIGGKVLDAKGRILPNVSVEISGGSLKENLTVTTDEQGRYLFDAVKIGETYIINIVDKSYVFAPKVITVETDRYDMDFQQ